MAALSGRKARIRYTAAGAASSTNEAATLSTDLVTLSINATAKRHWDPTSTKPRVYSSTSTGTLLSATKYDVNYAQGKVVFRKSSEQSSTRVYTLDVDYLTASYLTGGRKWALEANVGMLDVTAFSTSATNAQWRSFKPGLADWNVSIERLISTGDTGPFAYDRLAAGTRVLTELWAVGTGGEKYEGYGWVNKDGLSLEPGDRGMESVDVQGDGPLYYSTV